MVQHRLEPHRQLPPAAPLQLVRRRRQIVVTKHRRHRTQRPERALQPRHQRLERLAQRQRHIRPSAVAQHPLEQQVPERLAPYRHPQAARVREVERRFPTRNRHLLEVHLAIRAVLGPPLPDPPLQRPELPRLEATRMPPHSSRNSVSTCSRPSVSATNCGTTSDSHTSTNGSSRVRHVRGAFAVVGNAPSCQRRAVRSLIPAAAAAASSVFPVIRFSRNRRT